MGGLRQSRVSDRCRLGLERRRSRRVLAGKDPSRVVPLSLREICEVSPLLRVLPLLCALFSQAHVYPGASDPVLKPAPQGFQCLGCEFLYQMDFQ